MKKIFGFKRFKNGKNIYPFSGLSDFFFGIRIATFIFGLIISLFTLTFLGIVKLGNMISTKLNKPLEFINSMQNILKKINYSEILKVMLFIILILTVMYFITILMRIKLGEKTPFSNDKLARKIKRQMVKSLEVNKDIQELNDKRNRNNQRNYNRENKTDKNIRVVASKIKMAKVTVNTRKRPGTNIWQKEARVVIPQPSTKAGKEIMYSKINGLRSILTELTGGELSFEEPLRSRNGKEIFFYASTDLKEQEKLNQKGKNEEDGKYEFTFPLELLEDRTQEIEEKKEKAREYAEKLEKSISLQLKTDAVFKEMNVGNGSIAYIYKIVNSKFNINTKEEELEKSIRIRKMMVSSEAGDLRIDIPLPNELKIPMDMATMLKEMVSHDIEKTEVIIGMTTDNRIYHCSISNMTHALIAGATKSGKSVFINSALVSLMAHANPSEVKFVIVDPKNIEFTSFVDNPFMLMNPIVDMYQAEKVFNYLADEMDRRYDVMASYARRNDITIKKIEEYNEIIKKDAKTKEEPLNYIVLIVDELSDLMMQYPQVEIPIKRLGQKARAAGIHVVLGTQSPRTEVVTGLIKANMPTRISFKVTSYIESDIILGTTGAEKLAGKGDGLIQLDGGENTRFQGALVSNEEIDRILKYLKEKYPKPILLKEEELEMTLDTENDDAQKKSIINKYEKTEIKEKERLGIVEEEKDKEKFFEQKEAAYEKSMKKLEEKSDIKESEVETKQSNIGKSIFDILEDRANNK